MKSSLIAVGVFAAIVATLASIALCVQLARNGTGLSSPRSGPTAANFARLRVGMTRGEAEAIMGPHWQAEPGGVPERIEDTWGRIMRAATDPGSAWMGRGVYWTGSNGVEFRISTAGGRVAGRR
jgi:hypothetical protein